MDRVDAEQISMYARTVCGRGRENEIVSNSYASVAADRNEN